MTLVHRGADNRKTYGAQHVPILPCFMQASPLRYPDSMASAPTLNSHTQQLCQVAMLTNAMACDTTCGLGVEVE